MSGSLSTAMCSISSLSTRSVTVIVNVSTGGELAKLNSVKNNSPVPVQNSISVHLSDKSRSVEEKSCYPSVHQVES